MENPQQVPDEISDMMSRPDADTQGFTGTITDLERTLNQVFHMAAGRKTLGKPAETATMPKARTKQNDRKRNELRRRLRNRRARRLGGRDTARSRLDIDQT